MKATKRRLARELAQRKRSVIRIVVASENPVKINAAAIGFKKMFPGETFEVVGVSSQSGVPDQPLGQSQTLDGAKNRVEHAFSNHTDHDFYVGIEGGVDHNDLGTEVFAWVCVKDRGGAVGLGKTGSFYLPMTITNLIKSGLELSHATDQLFNETNTKHKNGTVGILTDDVIDRTAYYVEAIIYALIPFKNAALYFDKAAPATKQPRPARTKTTG